MSWQEIRRGVGRHETLERKIYAPESSDSDDGWCISSHDCWMPGVYHTREAAERALDLTEDQRCALRDRYAPGLIPLHAVLLGHVPVDALIEASSLGTPENKAMRENMPQEVVDRVLARADELERSPEPSIMSKISDFLGQPTLPKFDSVQTNTRDGTVSLMNGDVPVLHTTPATVGAILALNDQGAFGPVKTCPRCEWALPDCTCGGAS